MVEVKRIQRQRTKGWRMPPNTIYVGRPSPWGNPFSLRRGEAGEATMTRQYIADDYRRWLTHWHGGVIESGTGALICWCLRYGDRDAVLALLPSLRGHDLACWCLEDQPCHADVLLELAR